MYEELLERLHKRIALTTAGSPLQDDLEGAADAIKELQKAVNFHKFNSEFWEDKYNSLVDEKWIPVTEALPEEDGCYLVAVKNDHKRRYSKTAWFSHDSWFARQDVTHWMPLPEPPKEG